MEVVQSLATQKIQELLALCGIAHRSDEPIQEHITCIANYVHATRLEDGIAEFTDSILISDTSIVRTPPSSPTELRGSYRLLADTPKRSRDDFKGMTSPNRKKRKANQKSHDLGRLRGKVNTGDGDITARDVGNHTSIDPPPTTADIVTTDSAASGQRMDSPAHGGQENSRLASGPLTCSASMLGLDHSKPITDHQTDPTGRFSRLEALTLGTPTHLLTIYNPEEAIKTMSSILWNCVKYNNTVGKCGQHTQQVWASTDVEKMRQFVADIEQYEYEEAVHAVRSDNAFSAGKDMQARYNETVYWDIISKGAKRINPATLPTPKGPLDEFTMAEKVATKVFMQEAGFGTGIENQRRCRNLWKRLSELRKAEVSKILLYRTNEFDTYCKGFTRSTGPSLTDVIVSWEKAYRPFLEHLETRMKKQSRGDFAGASDLLQAHVAERLDVDERSWNNAINTWRFDEEAATFRLTCQPEVTSDEPLWCISDQHAMAESGRNKSVFTFLFPRNDRFLSVCPIVPVNHGDMLGVYAGEIRFTEKFDNSYGIRGPSEKLWLDYSQVTGTLNQMKVSLHVDEVNVRLHWELVNRQANTDPCVSWIVSVRAIKKIKPFEELVREAPQKEQVLLYRSEKCARRGFMKSGPESRAQC